MSLVMNQRLWLLNVLLSATRLCTRRENQLWVMLIKVIGHLLRHHHHRLLLLLLLSSTHQSC
jgi:hypothetical protein